MMNTMSQKQLMRFITEVSFAMDDIALYLDLHPTCKQAITSYESYKTMRQQAVKD